MDELQKFMEFVNGAAKAYGVKAPTGTATTNYTHGPGGLFGVAGLDEQVISARITPRGMSAMLPVSGSVFTNPLFPYITGYEESGSEPSGTCATCISGETESCLQTAQFGRVCRESKELEINDVMERINNGEIDLELVNSILGPDNVFVPRAAMTREKAINIQTAWSMVEVGIGLQNKLGKILWQGNPANNTAGGGYKEHPGLDMLIGTNKFDAVTMTACNALHSDVKDFNYSAASTVDGNGNFLLVRYINTMALYLKHNADRQNLMPVTWVIAMRPELWSELLEIYPLAYFSTRQVALPAGNTNFIDASRVIEIRDSMRDGMFIDTSAGRFEVVTDDGIFEYDSTNSASVPAGSFASAIYFVPLKYLGNRNATYLEYKDYRGANDDLREMNGKESFWITDDGRFMWVLEQLKWCYTLSGKIEHRVVLRVPQLAGKIEHVLYSPLQHFRSSDEDSDYFFKGGAATTTAPSLWSDWNYEDR